MPTGSRAPLRLLRALRPASARVAPPRTRLAGRSTEDLWGPGRSGVVRRVSSAAAPAAATMAADLRGASASLEADSDSDSDSSGLDLRERLWRGWGATAAPTDRRHGARDGGGRARLPRAPPACADGCCAPVSFLPPSVLERHATPAAVDGALETRGSPERRNAGPWETAGDCEADSDSFDGSKHHQSSPEAGAGSPAATKRHQGSLPTAISQLQYLTIDSDSDAEPSDSDSESASEDADGRGGGYLLSPPECESPRLASSVIDLTASDSGDDSDPAPSGKDYQAHGEGDVDGHVLVDSDENGPAIDVSSSPSSYDRDDSSEDEILTGGLSKTPHRKRLVIMDSDDESSGGDDRAIEPPVEARVSKVPRSNKKPSMKQPSFRRVREQMATDSFAEFDAAVFQGKLTGAGVRIRWSNRLLSTAGKTLLRRSAGLQRADIELSGAILDRRSRLRSTLLHEMCHAAAWIVDRNHSPPHGPVFKQWAARAQQRTGIAVTTRHTYDIAKYAWSCSTAECQVRIVRPTKSFKPDAVVCGKCGGRFVQVDLETGEPTVLREKKPPSQYNLFVKNNSKLVRQSLEAKSRGRKVTQSEVLGEVARRWKQASQASTT